jgi:hypothetical protein
MFKQYENEKYRADVAIQRQITFRIVAGAFAGAFIIGSLIWATCYYNVQSLKAPISINHTDVHSTQVDRGGSNN